MVSTKKGSLKNLVYQKTMDLIISSEFRAGEIITENQLIEKFQVSKSPVREALIQLCCENALRSIPRCGYQVVQISAKDIHDLTELRLYLELSSLHKIADLLDKETLTQLQTLTDATELINEADKWATWNDNRRFHLALAEVAGNNQVVAVLENVLATCTRAYAQIHEKNRDAIAKSGSEHYHMRIVKALENHDINVAHECLRNDIRVTELLLRGETPTF